ncbi:unnamed protein product [Effrenium voratum]|nr:unnamed protein product [Effrenium voratum]
MAALVRKGGKGVKGEAEEPLEADDAAVANAGSAGDKGKAKGKGKKGHGKEPEGSFLPGSLRPDEPFEDALREVLQRPKVEYPELQVHHIFNAVDGALQPHYEDLVHGLTGRIREFETSCVGAEKQHKAWIKERHRLGKECDELQRKAQEERGKAAHLSTAAANNNLRLLTGSTVPKVSQGHKRAINVVGAGGLDVNIQHLEKDVGKLDIDISTTRFKRLQAVVNTIYWRFLPQTRDIKYIASHYGEACGAFFRFHSTLLLISVITLACYSPLLVMQVLNSLPQ